MKLLSAALAFLLACSSAFAAPAGPVPVLTAQDLSGKTVQLTTAGRITVVVFLSSVCPISNDYNDRLIALHRHYLPKGIQFLFVNSNSNETPRDISQHARSAEYPFPILQDPGNHIADLLGATVTPEVFILDPQGMIRYKGQIDDARNPARVQVHAVKAAVEDLLAGREVARKETKAFGCTIKRVKKAS